MTSIEMYDIVRTECPGVSLSFNGRLRRLYGQAFRGSKRIEIAKRLFHYPHELQLSVLLHEIAHITADCGHCEKHTRESERLHQKYGLFEDRRSLKYHGDVYKVKSDGDREFICDGNGRTGKPAEQTKEVSFKADWIQL